MATKGRLFDAISQSQTVAKILTRAMIRGWMCMPGTRCKVGTFLMRKTRLMGFVTRYPGHDSGEACILKSNPE